MTLKRILLAVAICGGGLLVRQELRSSRQLEPEHRAAATAAPAPQERLAAPDPARIPRPPAGWDCEAMWRDGLVEQAQAFQKQGLCPAGFECWQNRAGETVCGTLKPVDERAVRELDEQVGRKPLRR